MRHHKLPECTRALILISMLLVVNSLSFAQGPPADQDLAKARELVKQGRWLDALPIFEKIGPKYPDDAEIQATYGISILVNAVTLSDSDARKKEIARGGVILKKAKQLGTTNVVALQYADVLEQGLEIDSVQGGASKEVEDAIREGEGYFGRGEYDKAFVAYERAYKINPLSYDAALFAGDCYYAQRKYPESETWFAKAVAIDPDREAAYRYWGDALLGQGKTKEALVKFADAYIADPGSRLSWDSFIRAVQKFGTRKSSPFIDLPMKEGQTEIVIDVSRLKVEDGTIHWKRFTEVRTRQIEGFARVANGKSFVSTVSDDVEALRAVVNALKAEMRQSDAVIPNKGLANLIKLDSLGFLDVYVMLFIHGQTDSYDDFRAKNRDRMRKFLVDYFAEDKL